jgi:C4-dicarboxylate-specific signal transduction histidine kinase
MALNRPTLGGPKPIGQGGGQAQATSAASEAGESDSQVSQLLDQIEGMTRNLRELQQNGADKNDPKKLMEAVNKMLDMLADLSKKLDERMQAAGQSFAQAAQAQPQG